MHPVQEIAETAEGAVVLPLFEDGRDHLPLQIPDVYKTDVDILSFEMGEVTAVVDAARFDIATGHPGFVDVEFGAVKSPEIVDNGHNKFQRIIGFQVETLERFHGKARRMRLAKGITAKAFH